MRKALFLSILLTLFGCAQSLTHKESGFDHSTDSQLTTGLESEELTYHKKGESLIVETEAYEIHFRLGAITYIKNKLTDEVYTASSKTKPEPCFIEAGLKPKRLHLSRAYQVKVAKNGNSIEYSVENRTWGLFVVYTMSFDKISGDLLITQKGMWAGKDIKGICFDVTNIDLSRVSIILPAEGGIIHTRRTPVPSATYDWPSGWQAGFAIGEGKNGGFNIWADDQEYLFKTLYHEKNADLASLSFETQNAAPFLGERLGRVGYMEDQYLQG